MYAAWKNIHSKYGASKIYITGGEPFLYPGFAGIISQLSKLHAIHVTTNLSVPLDEFISKNNASNVEINSTFHPLNTDPVQFAGNVLKLRKAGFVCNVCYLAHPLQLREMLNYKKYFYGLGIEMALTLFWGKLDGKEYPHAYSREEHELIDITEAWAHGEDDLKMMNENRGDSGAFNTNSEICIDKAQKSTNIHCNAGTDYAVIGVDGAARPCGQLHAPVLGNIFEFNIKLLELPLSCTEQNCRRRAQS